MATVTGITAAKANEILGLSITSAELDEDGALMFTRVNGSEVNAGNFNDVVNALVHAAVFEQAWPLGSIHMSVNPANPAVTLGGGVWQAWGSGRVPVGVDTGQTEFNAVEETGGAKTHTLTVDQIPSHDHAQDPHNHGIDHNHPAVNTSSGGGHSHTLYSRGGGSTGDLGSFPRIKRSSPEADPAYQSSDLMEDGGGVHSHSVDVPAFTGNSSSTTANNQNTGGGQAHNNLQPYITCYMWKRVG